MRSLLLAVCLSFGACAPPTSPVALECGPGTVLDPRTQQCVPHDTGGLRCVDGARLDPATQRCVATARTLECGLGTIPAPSPARGCVRAEPLFECTAGTTLSSDGRLCLADGPLPSDWCGPSTRLNDFDQCVPAEPVVTFDPLLATRLPEFEVRDMAVARKRLLHIHDVDNNRIRRVDLSDGAILPPVIGRAPIHAFVVDPDSGELYLSYTDGGVDVLRTLDGALERLTDVAGSHGLVLIDDRRLLLVGSGAAEIRDRETGEPLGRGEHIAARRDSRGVYVARHTAAYLVDPATSPNGVLRVDLSGEAPVLDAWPYHGNYLLGGRLDHDPHRDLLVSQVGNLIDPRSLRFAGSLGLPLIDAVRFDGRYHVLFWDLRDHFGILDETFNRIYESRVPGEPLRLFVGEGLFLVARWADELQVYRVQFGED